MSLNKNSAIKDNNKRKLDIRGKVCPMTFIYTKLNLEEMNKGEILDVLVDYAPSVENIPNSCRRQDLAEVIKIEEINSSKNVWQITLRKT